MWQKTTFLLLHCIQAAVASQCWQGATFSEAVVSPAVQSGVILRVPGVASLPQCVAACCDLPGYDLAWLFQGRCYVLSCQQRELCRPRQRPGADSVLVFLRRAAPHTLVLQSLVRGDPYGGRWRPLSRTSEAPGDLEALKDLALFERPRQDFSDPGMLDVEYSEGSQEDRDLMADLLKGGDGFNQSEAEEGPEAGLVGVAQDRASPGGNSSLETRTPAGPAGAEDAPSEENKSHNSSESSTMSPSLPWKPKSNSTPHDQIRTSPPTAAATLRQSFSTSTLSDPSAAPQPLKSSPGDPVDRTPPLKSSPGDPVELAPPLKSSPGDPVEPAPPTAPAGPSAAPPTASRAVTSDPAPTPPTASRAVTSDPTPAPATTRPGLGGSSRGPVAVVGPDRKLSLPVDSVLLDGSGSKDGAVYHWDAVSAPPGLRLEGADQAVATATGLRAGRYVFRLTVADEAGATDSASLTVRVQEARLLPPVAHASGSHTLTLPNNSLVLAGSMSDGDQTQVHFLWTRDSQSPAAGDVLFGSDSQASLYLANLVEGTYLFQLRVTDAQGRSSAATATVEVRPEPGGGQEVELEMQVSVSQVSVAQRDTVVRQLAALLHVLDGDVHVRALQGHAHLSTVLRFWVRGPSGPISSTRLVSLLRNQLLREKSDYLLFRVLRVDPVLCLLRCSGRGQCDPISKDCTCDPFWTENLIRRYLGDGESNCEWRVLFVVVSSFLLVLFILSVSWTFICCCRRRRQTRVRRKTKYTILDSMDEQERVELRPKFSIKHRSTEHNSSLMMSESELDSDQDTIFSRDRPVRSKTRTSTQAARNRDSFG